MRKEDKIFNSLLQLRIQISYYDLRQIINKAKYKTKAKYALF